MSAEKHLERDITNRTCSRICKFKVGTPGHSPKETRRNVGRLYHKQKPKAIMPSLMAAERGVLRIANKGR